MEYQKEKDTYDKYSYYSAATLKTQKMHNNEVQGCKASEKEEREKKCPVEMMRMINTDGVVSVGVNREKEVTVALSCDSTEPLLREDRNFVKMESAKQLRNVPDRIYTNSHDERVSAVVYKEDASKSPECMINTMKSALENLNNEVVGEIIPFLFSKGDKQRKKDLKEYMRGSLEQGRQEEYYIFQKEYDRLNQKIAWKEREEKRLIDNLTAVSGEYGEVAHHMESEYRNNIGDEGTMTVEEGEDQEEDKEEDQEEEDNHNSGSKITKK